MMNYSDISKALKRTENDLSELLSKKKDYKKKGLTKFYENEKNDLKRYIKQYEAKLKMPKYQKQKAQNEEQKKIKQTKKDYQAYEITVVYDAIGYRGGKITLRIDNRKESKPVLIKRHMNKKKMNELIQQQYNKMVDEIEELDEYIEGEKVKRTYKPSMYSAKAIKNSMLGDHYKDATIIRMKRVMPIKYNFMGNVDLNNPKEEGKCVIEFLVKHLTNKDNRKTITEQTIRDYFEEYMYKNNIEDEEGLCIVDIALFCEKFKISHYAFDHRRQTVHKKVFSKSNYPSIMYYSVDSHLYPITDKKAKEFIVRQEQNKERKLTKTAIVKHDDSKKKDAKQNEQIDRMKMNTVSINIDDTFYDKLDEYKNTNIMTDTNNLYDVYCGLFKRHNTAFNIDSVKNNIIQMIQYNNNVYIYSNKNDGCKKDYKTSANICETASVPFRNQSVQELGRELYEKYNKFGKGNDYIRKYLNTKDKENVIKAQNGKCNICKRESEKMEFDHKIPLHRNGSNDIDNIQGLCKKCHLNKSNLESATRLFDVDNTMSMFNAQTKDIFSKRKNGFLHHYSDIQKAIEKVERGEKYAFGLDMKKCRKNILRYTKHDFCAFSLLDNLVYYNENDEIKLGFYYVISENLFPLRGNGWYDYALVEYCLENKIIYKHNIRYAYNPSIKIKHDTYNDYIDYVYKTFKEEDAKIMINSFIGSFGSKRYSTGDIFLTKSIPQSAYIKWTTDEYVMKDGTSRICTVVPEDGFYCVKTTTTGIKDDGYMPIYNAILDREAMELHKIKVILRQNGGKMIYLNTDNAIALFNNEYNIEKLRKEVVKHYWDDEKKVLKYKEESVLHNRNECTEKVNRVIDKYDIHFSYRNKIQDPGHNNFEPLAKQLIDLNESFQLDAMAGCGKTYLLKTIMKQLDEAKKSYICLAPTHKAGRVMSQDALTLHKFCNILTTKKCAFDYIIIDEKSMMLEVFYNTLYKLKKRNPNTKFIISGDWRQLPPVGDRCDYDYANSHAFNELVDFNLVLLSECRRSDKELFKMYSNPSNIDLDKVGKKKCMRNLCYLNSTRKRINKMYMEKMAPKDAIIIAKNKINPQSQDMTIYKGLPIIACRTRKEDGFVNSDEGRVVKFTEKKIFVKIEGVDNEIELDHIEFGKSFYCAFAITVHKSQGITIEEDYTIYDWGRMDNRLKYVALSRAVSHKNINIIQ